MAHSKNGYFHKIYIYVGDFLQTIDAGRHLVLLAESAYYH